jgi:ABC-type Fe2+-enterobactin transport system substrate-binding protein
LGIVDSFYHKGSVSTKVGQAHSEQKAVIDQVVEHVATLDETLREAQATLKRLRIERELAERIERGIKTLRSKTGTADARLDDARSA